MELDDVVNLIRGPSFSRIVLVFRCLLVRACVRACVLACLCEGRLFAPDNDTPWCVAGRASTSRHGGEDKTIGLVRQPGPR